MMVEQENKKNLTSKCPSQSMYIFFCLFLPRFNEKSYQDGTRIIIHKVEKKIIERKYSNNSQVILQTSEAQKCNKNEWYYLEEDKFQAAGPVEGSENLEGQVEI